MALNRSVFGTTDRELKLMAAAAITGLRRRCFEIRCRMPATSRRYRREPQTATATCGDQRRDAFRKRERKMTIEKSMRALSKRDTNAAPRIQLEERSDPVYQASAGRFLGIMVSSLPCHEPRH